MAHCGDLTLDRSNVEADELGNTKRTGKARQQQRAVTKPGQRVRQPGTDAAKKRHRQGVHALRRLAVRAPQWHDLHPDEAPITPAEQAAARALIAGEAGVLGLDRDLGFVILHRAQSVLLLLVTVWRETNEMWECVYVKDAASADAYRLAAGPGQLRATFCVWELGVVGHERQAWVRYLRSDRNDAEKRTCLADRFAGVV